ncbi:DNA-directed RNA polymerase subunit beta' [Patescibacteria group bacterium]|nr:MAG: DNA-directed RNA polymerase subunit beta' [Patescibacteria group bacterium]
MPETYLPAPHVTSLDFDAIRLRLASPEVIRAWSHGEVTKPETINYRTQKPEKDGLFDERIFGPTKDWECYCGKYKKIRYKGIVCDKCGVEVTHSIVRRERMGHIALSAPVSHIWFLRGVPSKIGLVLDLSVMNLEKVIYFANFIITEVDEAAKLQVMDEVKNEFKAKKKQIEAEFARDVGRIAQQKGLEGEKLEATDPYKKAAQLRDRKIEELETEFDQVEDDLKDLQPMAIVPENIYHEWSLKFGHIFSAGIGAEAIFDLLKSINVKETIEALGRDLEDATGARRERIIRRVKLLKALDQNNIRPEWMILTAIPVIPPDLRPMVPLDGGRFATSDLNDLYRRVINRNNRLKRLVELNAPEVIVRNEKRMLQEAVDALLDNSARQSKTAVATTGKKRQLRSLADILKGKQGRFRQNLLGKRTDYSGRSVIVVGPNLKLHQCGLPKKMALELFRPFVISKLIRAGIVHNIRSANRYIEGDHADVWDILEEITREALVLLNRAPTLHRLGIQAFQPILIEGKAIRIHPLVCTAFNADFDGDQMAVHVPLTEEAKREAAELMIASRNLLKPATGTPVTSPNKDIAWGVYTITGMTEGAEGATMKAFASETDAIYAFEVGAITMQDKILCRVAKTGERMETNVGRILFNKLVPENMPYQNDRLDVKKQGELVRLCLELNGLERAAQFLDDIKELGFKQITKTGYSWGMMDLPDVSEIKNKVIAEGDTLVREVESQYQDGLLTINERHTKIIEIWTQVKDRVQKLSKEALRKDGSVFTMMDSGARGSPGQLTQMVGMKGLVSNPAGDIIELPVKAGFKEGFDVLEYFISTHGTRKGLSDTALRTANAGYLTRRLVDVAQDIIVRAEDCGEKEGMLLTAKESEEMGESLIQRITGRVTAAPIVNAKGKELIAEGELITYEHARMLAKHEVKEARIRSVLRCNILKGVCKNCYGFDLAYNKPIQTGVAVGIVAAQSIGEPGTQLTMRTFHTGGVAGLDITQGLPRVEELFEARPPKRKAIMAEEGGAVTVEEASKRTIQGPDGEPVLELSPGHKIVRISFRGVEEKIFKKERGDTFKVADGEGVVLGGVLFEKKDGTQTLADVAGTVRIKGNTATVVHEGTHSKEYIIPPGYVLYVRDGDVVTAGDALTEGNLDLQHLFRTKGREAVEDYIVKEIQSIYTSQGQKLNDKHIEIMVRQMFSRVYVKEAGDTELLPGEIVEYAEFVVENEKAKAAKGTLAEGELLLLGISKISLSTQSFLSAASFQETAKVLINAAVTGKIDPLDGLKENVIIGRIIPAGTGFEKRMGEREQKKARRAAKAAEKLEKAEKKEEEKATA